jgi:phage-related protein
METQKDLLSRIDGSIHEVVGGVVRIHDEVGKAVARTVKAGTFGAADEAVDKVQEAEVEVVKSVGEGFKQATTIVTETIRRVGQRLRGESPE